MKVITPNCRVQFTAEDIEFITGVLGKRSSEFEFLTQLLGDESSRDLLLDNDSLLHALLEMRGCLRVSSHFYFYVLVRHALRRAGIEGREVADYVAEMLTEFSREENLHARVPGQKQSLNYFFEMLGALNAADDPTRFLLRAHMGNQSLFMTGVFPERIRRRAERKGFPDITYFEALGQSSFREASHHRLAERYHLAGVFETLGDRFQQARRALNDVADRLFALGDEAHGVEGLLRRMGSPPGVG